MKKYPIIYADPPWEFRNKNTGGGMKSGAQNHYATMSIEQMMEMDIQKITTPDAILFMWWVPSQPLEALKLAKAWGFEFKTMFGFVWVKLTKRGKRWFGMGNWTRMGVEACLIATKGKIKRKNAGVRSLVVSRAYHHSKKPETVRGRILKLCGDLPRVELFSRNNPKGWDVFGNECENTIIIPKK